MPITLDRVSYIYHPGTPFARTALNDLSLHIPGGEITGITGEVGSGKSTMLQILTGLIKPAGGRVLVDDIDLAALNKRALARLRRRVGLVFQQPERQIFAYRVFDEVAFGPRNANLNAAEVNDRVVWALQAVGLPMEYRDRPTAALSAGEQRRVAIAGILALQPDYLLLDEPTAGLDREGAAQVMDTLRMMASQPGKTIVMVSHHLRRLLEMCDRIIWLKDGRVWLDLRREEIIGNYDILQDAVKLPDTLKVLHDLNQRGWNLDPNSLTPETLGEAIAEYLKGNPGNDSPRMDTDAFRQNR